MSTNLLTSTRMTICSARMVSPQVNTRVSGNSLSEMSRPRPSIKTISIRVKSPPAQLETTGCTGVSRRPCEMVLPIREAPAALLCVMVRIAQGSRSGGMGKVDDGAFGPGDHSPTRSRWWATGCLWHTPTISSRSSGWAGPGEWNEHRRAQLGLLRLPRSNSGGLRRRRGATVPVGLS